MPSQTERLVFRYLRPTNDVASEILYAARLRLFGRATSSKSLARMPRAVATSGPLIGEPCPAATVSGCNNASA